MSKAVIEPRSAAQEANALTTRPTRLDGQGEKTDHQSRSTVTQGRAAERFD